MTGIFDDVSHDGSGEVIAGAGVACTALARRCVRWGLVDSEFLAGVPGTVGGALAMNAGAFGSETWKHVTRAEVLDRSGVYRWIDRDAFDVGYREVGRPPDTWFVTAEFNFETGGSDGMARMRSLIDERKARQPLGLPSCGSVFRNPEGDHAGRLIEACGLKGKRIGGAAVSEKHANFIINSGDASARDIEQLILLVEQMVMERFGIYLQREVHIVGEGAAE